MKLPSAPCLLILVLIVLSSTARAQSDIDDYSFYRNPSVSVTTGTTLPQAWAGGMNCVRFFEIDLDFDHITDLVAFDKHGNRILPFLRSGNHYQYAPQYAWQFPNLHDWMVLYDYNSDGLPDIFTYGLAGISVYRNSSANGQLSFELQCDQLTGYYYNGYVNIYAAPTDYPVIGDIDGDGHLDILNFWVLGKFVHHLRNYSNDPEVFDFRLENECWGHFSESADDNGIQLGTDCDSKNEGDGQPLRHTGSTMLLYDFDQNGLPDMLLGDMDFPNLVLLHNFGTLTDARMTSMDTVFPTAMPVNLHSMPAATLVTLPGQEHASLIAAPADPSLAKSRDLHNVWRYDYNPTLSQYALASTDFLQEEMIDVGSGALPVLYDWSGDGLPDLFIANYGSFDSTTAVNGFTTAHFSASIHYFENTGTPNHPEFQLQSSDFGNLKGLNIRALYPTFGDFDGDAQTDMLCGRDDGTLLLVPYGRITDSSSPAAIVENFQNIDAGKFSTPQYFDLDNDGRKDLLIGNQRGLISYYRDISTNGAPVFSWVTDTLGGVDVRDFEQSYYGYSVPCFYRDSIHGTALFCGSESGNLFYYSQIDNNLSGTFRSTTVVESEDATCEQCAHLLREGIRSGCAVYPLTHPDFPDLVAGNYAGGLSYFAGRTPTQHTVSVSEVPDSDWTIYPNPATEKIEIISPNHHSINYIRIYDMAGRLCIGTDLAPIDIRLLAQGIYIVEINGNVRKKLIVGR